MPRYGYRVHTLAAGKRNSWRNPEPLGDLGAAHVARVHALLAERKGDILKYRPDLRPADDLEVPVPETDMGAPVMVIESVVLSGNTIRCEVIHGRLGDHDELLGEGVERIGDKAAGRRYRVDLIFPTTGTYGLAVTETCVRFSPADDLLRWLAYFDKVRAFEAQERLNKAELSASEEVAALTADMDWRKHRISQISDANYLRSLISNANKVSVDLVEAGRVTRRGRYRDVEHRLQVLDVDDGLRADIGEEILHWLDGENRKGAVKRVMGMLGLDRKKLAGDGLGFNNTTVHIAGIQPVSVTPGTVRDLFTYPLAGTLRLDDVMWEQATRAKVVELAGIEQVDLDL